MIAFLIVVCFALFGIAWQLSCLLDSLRFARFALTAIASELESNIENGHQLRGEAEKANAHLLDVGANLVLLRGTLESVIRVNETPTLAAIEAPQVPIPHGEAKTLHLLNADGTIAHEVTQHRPVTETYAYGGRVFQLIGRNDDTGSWEFAPL